jgi:hypothetical protein
LWLIACHLFHVLCQLICRSALFPPRLGLGGLSATPSRDS